MEINQTKIIERLVINVVTKTPLALADGVFYWVTTSMLHTHNTATIKTAAVHTGIGITDKNYGSSPDRVGKVNKIVKGPHDWIVRHSSW